MSLGEDQNNHHHHQDDRQAYYKYQGDTNDESRNKPEKGLNKQL